MTFFFNIFEWGLGNQGEIKSKRGTRRKTSLVVYYSGMLSRVVEVKRQMSRHSLFRLLRSGTSALVVDLAVEGAAAAATAGAGAAGAVYVVVGVELADGSSELLLE